MKLIDFYQNLPKPEQYPAFYVPYYTEALSTYTGVRVIPDSSYVDGVEQVYKTYLLSVGFPCYFIPIHKANKCFGFVLKGREKKTPRYCLNFYLPGVENLRDNKPVVFVEGFKDSYLLRSANIPCLAMLTSQITTGMLDYLRSHNNYIIYIPDNDTHRNNSIESFERKVGNIPHLVYCITGLKDLGDYFDPSLRDQAIKEASRIIKLYNRIEEYGKL